MSHVPLRRTTKYDIANVQYKIILIKFSAKCQFPFQSQQITDKTESDRKWFGYPDLDMHVFVFLCDKDLTTAVDAVFCCSSSIITPVLTCSFAGGLADRGH